MMDALAQQAMKNAAMRVWPLDLLMFGYVDFLIVILPLILRRHSTHCRYLAVCVFCLCLSSLYCVFVYFFAVL